jgi:aryl-alcohol dehydrogenase-like predicted oxidoreductase
LFKKVEEIAQQKGCAPSQIALAWLLAQGEDLVAIPGTKRRKYLEENIAAAEITLSTAELDQITSIFPYGITAGARYHERGMQSVNR